MIRIDAHQHFWKYTVAEYGWINDKMTALQRDFLPRDLKPLLDENGFGGSIAVQARQSLEETHWLLELAEKNSFIQGVVGWVDLNSPLLRDQLEGLAPHKKLVGVRHVVQDEPDDQFMLRSEFQRGLALLADFGLAYDLLLHPRHLPIATQLVRQYPAQTFVLDHLAKPAIADGVIEPWRRDIRELAKCPNVSCKLSGMVTEARWKTWMPGDFRPYLDAVLDAFGASRLMIGSDWPVCTLSAEYAQTQGIVIDFLDRLTEEQRDGILGGNCARIYRIATA
ncbi:MAG TPA: amidohydrolase family protein [Terracidiphilus sp.]|nr:amidohydrolase family protein [Terracidiphilus sp.]